MLAPWQAASSK